MKNDKSRGGSSTSSAWFFNKFSGILEVQWKHKPRRLPEIPINKFLIIANLGNVGGKGAYGSVGGAVFTQASVESHEPGEHAPLIVHVPLWSPVL